MTKYIVTYRYQNRVFTRTFEFLTIAIIYRQQMIDDGFLDASIHLIGE